MGRERDMKYIIESNDVIGYTPKYAMLFGDGYMIQPLEDLEELNSDYINEHFGDLQDTAYQRGLNEAWECGKKLAWTAKYGGYGERLSDVFGRDDTFDFYDYTPNEAIAKLKAYEEKQNADDEIKVGDEVIYNNTIKCLVVRPETDERYAVLIDGNGHHHSADHRECKKTGRHFDIKGILEAMKHD
jgi:hypothetical protein